MVQIHAVNIYAKADSERSTPHAQTAPMDQPPQCLHLNLIFALPAKNTWLSAIATGHSGGNFFDTTSSAENMSEYSTHSTGRGHVEQ